jgi:arginyl-tRNA synthetase
MTSPLTKKQWEASVAEMWSASVKATCQDLIDEAVKAEREACAMIVEENANRCGVDTVAWMLLASNAQAIRARGQA